MIHLRTTCLRKFPQPGKGTYRPPALPVAPKVRPGARYGSWGCLVSTPDPSVMGLTYLRSSGQARQVRQGKAVSPGPQSLP